MALILLSSQSLLYQQQTSFENESNLDHSKIKN